MPNYIAGVGDKVLLALIGLLFILIVSVVVFLSTCRNYVHTLFHSRLPGRAPNQAEPGYFNPDFCPICLNNIQLAVETNCGHLYCGGCLAAYNVEEYLEPLSCPLCRQSVIMFFTAFSQNELTADPGSPTGRQAANIIRMIQRYNHRFSCTPHTFWEMIRDVADSLRQVEWKEIFTLDGAVWMFRVRYHLFILIYPFYVLGALKIIPLSILVWLIVVDLFVFIFVSINSSLS